MAFRLLIKNCIFGHQSDVKLHLEVGLSLKMYLGQVKVTSHLSDKVAKSHLSHEAKKLSETWGEPRVFNTNKSRPHLSTYITIQESQEGAVLVHERSWI